MHFRSFNIVLVLWKKYCKNALFSLKMFKVSVLPVSSNLIKSALEDICPFLDTCQHKFVLVCHFSTYFPQVKLLKRWSRFKEIHAHQEYFRCLCSASTLVNDLHNFQSPPATPTSPVASFRHRLPLKGVFTRVFVTIHYITIYHK